ncbi:hypothetical protein [Aggregatilinea lenta]|uniref:hypothetical protein n=1 Tax=Aggregatilinea lenta TaxID=913108 RepID=UPI000E5B3D4A|nr:hypothetical protein [Aggregatilinea lenta]
MGFFTWTDDPEEDLEEESVAQMILEGQPRVPAQEKSPVCPECGCPLCLAAEVQGVVWFDYAEGVQVDFTYPRYLRGTLSNLVMVCEECGETFGDPLYKARYIDGSIV